MKVTIFGATGMVGEGVLHVSLASPEVASVLVVGRRTCEVTHPKLTEIIHSDFYDYTAIADRLAGYDACFFCLGVTSIGKNEEEYRRLTYDLTMAAATTLARMNPQMTFCYVSGTGTDSTEKGKLMWARIKGKTENDLMKLPFKAVYAFRPGFIKPMPGMKRTIKAAKFAAPLYPLFLKLWPNHVCTLEEVGNTMVRVALHVYRKPHIECEDLHILGR